VGQGEKDPSITCLHTLLDYLNIPSRTMPADSSPLPGSRRRYSSTTTETLSGITSGGSSTLLNDAGNSMNNLGGDCTTSSSNNNNSNNNGGKSRPSKIYDDPITTQGYQMVPMIEVDNLPRGGISFETKAVGRIQVSKKALYFHQQRKASSVMSISFP
jgi:hypothetical protein